MQDREWLIPSVALTLVSGAIALALIPDTSGIMPAVGMLPFWMIASGLIAVIYSFFLMVSAGVESPLSRIREFLVHERRILLVFVLGIFLAGLNMTTFMWTKPLLNHLVPFWADPMLAEMDHVLFLGHDPWTLLGWLNGRAMAIFYHRGWFAMLILALIVVLAAAPSPRKSALIFSYFFLWSVAGPLVHILLPAGGPIFYEAMGYGDRFAGLHAVSETRDVADYLWRIYAGGGFGPGSGISAMPSMHIATTCWIVLVIHHFAPRWRTITWAAATLIFLLSIALGWHYAMDGVVGAAVALATYRAFLFAYSAKARAGKPSQIATA